MMARTLLRMIRAKAGMQTMPIAIVALVIEGPSAVMIASARMSCGNPTPKTEMIVIRRMRSGKAIQISTPRWASVSSQPPK